MTGCRMVLFCHVERSVAQPKHDTSYRVCSSAMLGTSGMGALSCCGASLFVVQMRFTWAENHPCYPILLIFLSFSSSMILIFRPSTVIRCSAANCDRVRMAFEVVMFDKFAKSSRER